MKKKAFTLIELIAVLVILAILALIVTPLVMNIIKKVKDSSNRRSVDAYGRSVELAITSHLMDTGSFPTDLSSLTIEYTGKVVVCNVMKMKENGGIYLSECTVGTKEVKDSSTEDGWYHYGTRDITNEEYVDMYGLALKNASVAYYNANGNPVSDYTTLTIDYTGKPVSCDVTVNYDGTIYMTKCKVNNVDVTDDTEDGYYHYGAITFRPYNIGDQVSYNNVDYYVIKDTDSNVTLLKAEPLTVEEVNQYGGVGTANNHVNMYATSNTTSSYYQTAYNINGYGGMAYYTSETCGYSSNTGCTTDYAQSEIKYVVDAWKTAQAPQALEARLITYEELTTDLGCTSNNCSNSSNSWLYNSKYRYWTMSQYQHSAFNVWNVRGDDGSLYYSNVDFYPREVRPVITISKSALEN